MSGWRKTLKTFASWDKDTLFVPGHGPVCGQEGIQSLRDLFDDLAMQAEKMHKAGVPLSDATRPVRSSLKNSNPTQSSPGASASPAPSPKSTPKWSPANPPPLQNKKGAPIFRSAFFLLLDSCGAPIPRRALGFSGINLSSRPEWPIFHRLRPANVGHGAEGPWQHFIQLIAAEIILADSYDDGYRSKTSPKSKDQ